MEVTLMGRNKITPDSDESFDPLTGKNKRKSNDVKDIFDEMDEDLN